MVIAMPLKAIPWLAPEAGSGIMSKKQTEMSNFLFQENSMFSMESTMAMFMAPTYCQPTTTSASWEYITNVNFAGIDNSTGGTSGINDYTDQIAEVTAGETETLSVTVNADSSDYLSVFIDWNQNGSFSDPGEEYVLATSTSSDGPFTQDITIPTDAVAGDTGMRVIFRFDDAPEPCTSFYFGEIEDYTVRVTNDSEGGGEVGEACFAEDFSDITSGNSTSTSGSSVQWFGNDNFPTVDRAYQAGGAVRLGTGSVTGFIESRNLDEVSGDVSVNIDVKGWTTLENTTLNVSLDGQTENVAYTALMADDFETVTVQFTGVTAGSNLKIETSNRRAFIDNVEIICEDGGEEPGYDCSQSIASNNMENGGFIGGDTNQRLAIDINVNTESTFAIDQIKLNLIQDAAPTYINIIIREDVAGIPGNALHTFNNVSIIDSEFVGSNFGFDFYTHTLDFSAEDLVLDGGATGAKFWMELETDAVAWESTTAAVNGLSGAFFNDNTGGVWMIGTDEYVYELIGTCTGEEPEVPEGGCITAPNGAYPSTAFTPSCLGTTESITDGDWGWFGEYSIVNVTAGVEYTFSTDVSTAYITIANNGGTIYAFGTGSVTWTATASETVRFYTHENENCLSSTNWVDRMVQCGEAPSQPEEPDFPCFFGDGLTSSFDNAFNIELSNDYRSADDFIVEEGTVFTMQHITIDVNQVEGPDYVEINIREDNGGTPGAIIETITQLPDTVSAYGTAYGDPIYHMTFDLDTPIEFTEGTYWLDVKMTQPGGSTSWWLATSTGSHGAVAQRSIDDGVTWSPDPEGLRAVFFVAGECEEEEPGEPGYDCSQSIASNNMENGGFIGGDTNQRLAIDINVNTESTFAIDQIKLNLIQDAAPTYINIIIREDVAGIPGDALHTFNNVSIIDSEFVGSNFGFDFYTHTLDFSAEDLVLDGGATGAKFWMEVESDADGWESTTAAVNGSAGAFFNDNTGGVWMIGTSEYVYELIGTCTGEEVEPEEGCLTAPNGAYPSAAFTPSCFGTTESITGGDWGWFGEYSIVNVTDGVEYTFSTDVPTAYITISNGNGTSVYATGTGSVTWTATASETVRFYTHENENCLSSSNWVDRMVQCGEAPSQPEEPDFPCFFGDGLTSSFDNAFNIELSNDYRSADDFIVEEGTVFTMQHITIDVNQVEGPDYVEINIREDNGGTPGAIIETITQLPDTVSAYGVAFGDPIYHMTFDLDTPIEFTEGTYWLDVKMSQPGGSTSWWLATSTGSHGSVAYRSENDGATWSPDPEGLRMVFFVAGECEELGISDLSAFDFAYYPNPVKDVLNITSKKEVESVAIYNLAGQAVTSDAKASNGQINVSTLQPGTYVFRVTLEGGQVETFKVIKK
jgi:hypothetical protein